MTSRNYALKGAVREQAGKGVARALRRENKVPGVIYGDGKEPVSISLSAKEINLEYNKGHMFTSLCDLEIDGKTHKVLARDVQLHPVKDTAEHVDFIRVTPKTKIRVHVPVNIVNEETCVGLVKSKGTLNFIMHEIDLICVAQEIPDHIDIDVKDLDIGDSIHFSAVTLPKGAEFPKSNRDPAIVSIAAPRRVLDDAPVVAEGDAAAAPAAGAAAPAAAAKPAAKK